MMWLLVIFLLVFAVPLLSSGAPAAWAVEYRLLVANLHEQSYFYYVGRNGAEDRLDRLDVAQDSGRVPPGVFIPDRAIQPLQRPLVGAFESVVARPKETSPGDRQWDEIHWEGPPGGRTVWVISGASTLFQEVTGVGLRAGSGPFRHYYPYRAAALSREQLRALVFPLTLIQAAEGKTGLWSRWLQPRLDLRNGLAVIVGENPNLFYPDPVYVVIENAPEPTTYKLALAWRHRPAARIQQFEGVGDGGGPFQR